MQTQTDNGVSYQEVSGILEHVQQAIAVHKNMQQAIEYYLEQNGVKKEYEKYKVARVSKQGTKKRNSDCSTVGNKNSKKNVKKQSTIRRK